MTLVEEATVAVVFWGGLLLRQIFESLSGQGFSLVFTLKRAAYGFNLKLFY